MGKISLEKERCHAKREKREKRKKSLGKFVSGIEMPLDLYVFDSIHKLYIFHKLDSDALSTFQPYERMKYSRDGKSTHKSSICTST